MRIDTVATKVFSFSELSDTAKKRAIELQSQSNSECWDSNDTECIYEDAATIGALIGINIDVRSKKNPASVDRYTIYYSGFSSQGDGACFEGSYRYKKGALAAIKSHAPKDEELHRIAKELQEIQKGHFYRLHATMTHSGHYYHSGCMNVQVFDWDNENRDIGDAEKRICQLMRDFADWIYKQLEAQYDYVTSEENCKEQCESDGEVFTESGARY